MSRVSARKGAVLLQTRRALLLHAERVFFVTRASARGRCTSAGELASEGLEFRVQDSGFRVSGFGFRVQGSGFKILGAGFWVQEGLRVEALGSSVWGFGVLGSEFRVQGAGFRVRN